MKSTSAMLVFISTVVLLLAGCLENNSVAGDGTEVGTVVSGIVQDSSGRPQQNTEVLLVPHSFRIAIDVSGSDNLADRTDARGAFSIPVKDPGQYTLEAAHPQAGKYIDMGLEIEKADKLSLDPFSLEQPGILEVEVPRGAAAGEYLFIPSTSVQHQITPGDISSGTAFLGSLAPGVYPSVMLITPQDQSSFLTLAENVQILSSGGQRVEYDAMRKFRAGSGWAHTATLILNTGSDSAGLNGNVTDFPLIIKLDKNNFNFSQAISDGRDIRFSKLDGTPMPFEIEAWDAASQKAAVWVLLDTVSAGTELYFFMYWGNENAEKASDGRLVFNTDNGFTGVWHLQETPSTEPDGFKDATFNGADGTGSGFRGAEVVPGVSGGALYFDGVDDYIALSDSFLFEYETSMTVAAWVRLDSFDVVFQNIVSKGDYSWRLQRFINYNELQFSVDTAGGYRSVNCPVVVNDGAWHLITGVYDGDSLYLFIDGAQKNSSPAPAAGFVSSAPVWIGNNSEIGVNERFWHGYMDEIRLSESPRSAEWIKLCYETQKEGASLVTIVPR